jgi:hypothetical protein
MTKKSQIQKFRDKARELSADPSEEHFNVSLKAVGRQKPSSEPKRSPKSPRKRRSD